MTMTKFKKSIKIRLTLIRAFFFIVLVVLLYHQFGNFVPLPEPKDDLIACFQIGLLLGVEILLIFASKKYRNALESETELEAFYNSEHDERKNYIRQKAGVPVMLITSILILFFAIIAGYFNIVIFYTLFAVAMGQLLVCTALKFIYMKKY